MWYSVVGLLVIVILPGHARKSILPRYVCDHDHNTVEKEGNQGPVGKFPWLGVIRVTLSEGTKIRIAITGAVLIRITFAIANAEDIAKIPNKILRDNSKAMFISSENSPWLYDIRGYDAAPDFKTKTASSIALVELELKDDPTPLMPICWQDSHRHLSHKHYGLGFTDERYVLEKIAYDMFYINKTQCEIYYENLDIRKNSQKYVPVHYECWAAMKNTRNCLWENGMVLVSNYTGTWFLIGIGIRGPGCSLPVRFISVLPYVNWIESVIDEAYKQINNEKMKPRVKELPAHAFFPSENERANEEVQEIDGMSFRRAFNPPQKASKSPPDQADDGTRPIYHGVASDYDEAGQGSGRRASAHRRIYVPYSDTRTVRPVLRPKDHEGNLTKEYALEHWKRDDIRHMDPNVLQFKKFFNKYERVEGDCRNSTHMVYKEIIEVKKTPNVVGYAYYKLSLVDLEMYRYTCVVLRVISRSRSDCNLWYSFVNEMDEPLGMLDDTPEEILKNYIPSGERSTTGPFEKDAIYWKPHQNLKAFFKKEGNPWDTKWWSNATMFNLYLRFDFDKDAELVLEVWAHSSELLRAVATSTKTPLSANYTRTRKKGHKVTRSWTTTKTTRSKRTRTKPPSLRVAQTKPKIQEASETPPMDTEDALNKTRMKKATITKTDSLWANSGSKGSDYVESGLCLIVILFIITRYIV